MELSPGVQLVWNLAAREAIAARVEEIQPEHFFCALLKFAQLEDDDLEAVAARPPVAKVLIAERDALQAIFEKRSLSTSRVRRQLRQALGRGNYQHSGDVVHRSPASRELFDRAVEAAGKDKSILESHQLLQALLEEPTPAMAVVMQDVGVKAPSAEPPAETPLLSQYGRDLLQLTEAGRLKIPEGSEPQVQVVSLAVQSVDPAPILLICAPQVDVMSIVGRVAQELRNEKRVVGVDCDRMVGEMYDPEAFATQVADLLAETAEVENLVLFAHVMDQRAEVVSVLLSALKPALAAAKPRLVVAVSAEVYHNVIEPDPVWGGVFRTIWLHELAQGEVPVEL